ncbi:MAG: hypothetical protein Q4A79_02980 [Candidatus Saccharibacteria bacterium]|nr:hypothetical protein [Candidatus Saccharibacteria bacterium]
MKNHETFETISPFEQFYSLPRCKTTLSKLLEDAKEDAAGGSNHRLSRFHPHCQGTISILEDLLNSDVYQSCAGIPRDDHDRVDTTVSTELSSLDDANWSTIVTVLAEVAQCYYAECNSPDGNPSDPQDPFFRELRVKAETSDFNSAQNALYELVADQRQKKHIVDSPYSNHFLCNSIFLIWEMDSDLEDGFFGDEKAMSHFDPNIIPQPKQDKRRIGNSIIAAYSDITGSRIERPAKKPRLTKEGREQQKVRREHLEDFVSKYCGELIVESMKNSYKSSTIPEIIELGLPIDPAALDKLAYDSITDDAYLKALDTITEAVLKSTKDPDNPVSIAECLYILSVSAKSFPAMKAIVENSRLNRTHIFNLLCYLYANNGLSFSDNSGVAGVYS